MPVSRGEPFCNILSNLVLSTKVLSISIMPSISSFISSLFGYRPLAGLSLLMILWIYFIDPGVMSPNCNVVNESTAWSILVVKVSLFKSCMSCQRPASSAVTWLQSTQGICSTFNSSCLTSDPSCLTFGCQLYSDLTSHCQCSTPLTREIRQFLGKVYLESMFHVVVTSSREAWTGLCLGMAVVRFCCWWWHQQTTSFESWQSMKGPG